MSPFFRELQLPFKGHEELLRFAQDQSIWNSGKEGFDIVRVPVKLWFKSKALSSILMKFGGVPIILKMPAHSHYLWHTDKDRLCTINMLLNSWSSQSMFGEPHPTTTQLTMMKAKVPYEPGKMFAFNTQELHSVVNDSDEDRMTLSVTFQTKTSYQDLVNYLDEQEF